MKIKWIIVIISSVVVGLMALIVEFGLKPRPIRVLNPTAFERPEEIGAVLYRRLRQDLRRDRVVGLGDAPWVLEPERIWNGLIAVARTDGVTVREVRESARVRPIIEFSGVSLLRSLERAADLVRPNSPGALGGSANWFVNHGLYSELPVFDDEAQGLRFWVTRLAVDSRGLSSLQPPCPESPDQTSVAIPDHVIGCAALRASSNYLRKNLDSAKIWASAEKHGRDLYIIFVHDPRAIVNQTHGQGGDDGT